MGIKSSLKKMSCKRICQSLRKLFCFGKKAVKLFSLRKLFSFYAGSNPPFIRAILFYAVFLRHSDVKQNRTFQSYVESMCSQNVFSCHFQTQSIFFDNFFSRYEIMMKFKTQICLNESPNFKCVLTAVHFDVFFWRKQKDQYV